MNSPEPVIEVNGLYKSYKGFDAVNGISFNVYRGDVFGFLGPNGAGKSTTIRMLLSLIKPTAGTVRVFGKILEKEREFILQRTGAIVEKPDLYNYMTAFQNMRVLGAMSGKKISAQRIMEVLELVGLADRAHDKIKTYSHGMKQRAGLAQAIIHDPELIILDEPTTGLDPSGMVAIRELILKLSREHHKTILLSSHILNEVELVANRMIILNKGKVVVEGEVDKLLNSGELKVSIETLHPEKARSIIAQSAFRNSLQHGSGSTLHLHIGKESLPALNKLLVEGGAEVVSLIPVRSLEAYFLSLT